MAALSFPCIPMYCLSRPGLLCHFPRLASWPLLPQLTGMTVLAALDLSGNCFSPEEGQDVFAPLAGLERLRELYMIACMDKEAPGGSVELQHPGLEVGRSATLCASPLLFVLLSVLKRRSFWVS